ncbi:MAG: hypothetical protein K6E33_04565 [Lachnospiraceae bacterium]|nr:hypothetical protein [Lachnospiraceae bacterium]
MRQFLTVYTHEVYSFDDGSRVTVSQDRINQGRCLLRGQSESGTELFYLATDGNIYEYNPLPLIKIEMHKRGVSEELTRRTKLIEYHLEPTTQFSHINFNITPGEGGQGVNLLFHLGKSTHIKTAYAVGVDFEDFPAVRAYTDYVFRFYSGFGKG